MCHPVICLLLVCSLLISWTSRAQTVPQAAPDPILLTPGTGSDDLQVLMAAASEHPSTVMVPVYGPNKNVFAYYNGGEYLAWNVQAPAAASYRVFALISANAGQTLQLLNQTNGAVRTLSTSGSWERVDIGTLSLNSGTNRLVLTRTGSVSGQVKMKSLELIRDADYAAHLGRVAAKRADSSWLAQSKYGLFFQYGSWGYPANVGDRKSLDQQANDFHVPSFVEMVKQSGASYVMWSFSWWGYRPDMPNAPVDAILGDGSYTAQRNLIGEIAAALKAQNIRFMLYYHTGTEEAGWWGRQAFPSSTFPSRGTGDRSTFFKNWSDVVADIGATLGTDLDGFFFDDGMIYYPAKFEQLQSIARMGNPNRVISWNSYVMPRFTDFQDVWFGENSHGEVEQGSGCCDGKFVSGPQQGLLQQGMFPLENWADWGVHGQNQKIPSTQAQSNSTLISQVSSAASRGVPLSLNLSMYEDGTVTQGVLQQLAALRNAIYGISVSVPTWTDFNNEWANISYSGTWTRSGGRNAGDYQNDVRYTPTNGDSFTVSFVGSGITIYGPMSTADGTATVSLDGVPVSTLSATFGGGYSPQQHLLRFSHLPSGSHTVTVTKTGGSYLQLDKVSIASP